MTEKLTITRMGNDFTFYVEDQNGHHAQVLIPIEEIRKMNFDTIIIHEWVKQERAAEGEADHIINTYPGY